MDDCDEASLLRKLESSDYTGIHDHYSRYLQPLTLHLLNPQIPTSDAKKSSKSKSNSTPSPSSSTIRSLVKSYLPFLNRSLSLLPKRLTDSPKPSAAAAAELFDTYKLCLDCIGCFTSLLSCKPYTVHLQTSRLVRCFVEWGRYSEAMDEGLRVLRDVSKMNLDGILDSRESLVPVLVDGSGVDDDLAYLVVEVFLRVLQSVSMSKTKEEGQYMNLLAMLNGIQPWFRVLDTSVSHKFKRMLLSYLNNATRFLAKLGADVLPNFCAATFNEYQKILVEQAVEVETLKLSAEFLQLLSCCAYECRASCMGIYAAVAASMLNMDLEPFAFISRLYACGLHISGSRLQINWDADSTTLADNSQVQELNSLLSSTETFCAVYLMEKRKDTKADETRRVHLKFYLDALKFLCRPLADFVNSERKYIINQVLDCPVKKYLQNVQKLFDHLCKILLSCQSCSHGIQRDGSEAFDKTVLKVSVASFALSLKLNLTSKESYEFLQFLFSETNLQHQEMKYIIVSLYDISLDCYRSKQLKECIKAMELCFDASWNCGLKLCQKNSGRNKQSTPCLSEDAISDIATKAAMTTSFFLDILFEENSNRLVNAIVYSLRKWSAMRDLFEKLPSPLSFIRQWVKIQIKLYKKADDKKVGPALCTYLMDSGQGESSVSSCVSKGAIMIILEQELSAYQEMSNLCPAFCREMGMKIIDQLLHYMTGDDWFARSIVLIKKGRIFRESGTECLKDSIQCLSEAIDTILSENYGDAIKSVKYWLSCMKDAPTALLGFKQNLSILCTQFPQAFGWYEHTPSSNDLVDDIKQAAQHSISSGRNDSVFMVGCLYYDLAERLLSTGRLIEALHWSKQSHQLRTKLLQDHFSYRLEDQEEKHSEHGDVIRNQPVCAKDSKVCTHIAIKIWDSAASSDLEHCYLTPWKVLECYLESNLQVGIVQEAIGNGTEAEALFSWGKSISCIQGLPLFTVAFSAGLGKVYHKMRQWEIAEKELQSAKEVLSDSSECNACLRCHLMMESNVDGLLGNFYHSKYDNSGGNSSMSPKSVEEYYKSAIATLNSSEWKGTNKDNVLLQNLIATKAASCGGSNINSLAIDLSDSLQSCSIKEQGSEKKDKRRVTRKKKESSGLQNVNCQVTERTSRITRSRNLSSQEKVCNGEREVLDMPNKKCLKCLYLEDTKADSFTELIHITWELGRRKQLLRVLIDLGKWKQNLSKVHEAHVVYSQCISLLRCRNPFCDCSHSETCIHKLEIINKEVSEDIFAVERAALLYSICWFSLSNLVPREMRTKCCYLSHIEVSDILSLLIQSSVLCREVPLLFEKVSRLLATIFVISACRSNFSSMNSSLELSENHWAAYFHQASVSARHNYWVLSHLDAKRKHVTDVLDAKGSQVHDTSGMLEDMHCLFRLAPDSTESVPQFVKDFFDSLPTTTIVCLSILGGSYASILKALVPHSASCSWMLLSHLNANSEPVVVLLPVDTIDRVKRADPELATFSCEGSCICFCEEPSVVDAVAPAFKSILSENRSSSVIYSEDTNKNRSMWWGKRKSLDRILSKLLVEMEESWFGPWRYLLLGQWSENDALESAAKKLAGDLKRKCHLDVKVSLLKAVVGAAKFASKEEASIIPQVVLEKGCYVGTPGENDDEAAAATYISREGYELMLATVKMLEEEHGTNRESVILVLDSEVQMLPWENIPILREQEVYRMPSISCISAILQKTRPVQGNAAVLEEDSLPLIDPLDAFYLVNPSGDLGATQTRFEEWLRGQNMEGRAGIAPSSKELSEALKCHDVFLYFGHGSGAQYISSHEVEKLEKCAACVLMGCSSGSINLNGCYSPRGVAYSYISAGSPVVIANLWSVTDKEIDRFGRAVLEAWLTERSNSLSSCVQCSMLAEEVTALTLNKKTRNTKKGKGKKQSQVASDSTAKNWCRHKAKVGYFVSKARNACTLPYLTGAAPVCYGVPTGIRKKNDF